MTVQGNYEVSSEGAVRRWEFTYARLCKILPLITEATKITSILPGTQITGTIIGVDATLPGTALVDVTRGAIYRHSVRNVRTYFGAAEATWGTIAEGDPIYCDYGATMIALDLQLSASPLDSAGVANPLFGFAVGADDADRALFPKGAAGATTVTNVAVIQRGA